MQWTVLAWSNREIATQATQQAREMVDSVGSASSTLAGLEGIMELEVAQIIACFY